MRQSLPPLKQAAICLVFAALACWLTILTWPISERFPFAFFLAAVVATAWACGPAASIFTTALCTAALGLIYYWRSPTNGLELVQENLPRLALFLFTGLLTSYLVRECRGAIRAVDRVHIMLGHLGEALITTDDQGMIRYVNDEAQTLTGCEAREVIGKPLGHVLTLLDERTHQPLPQPSQTVIARRVAVDLPAGALLQTPRGKGVAVEGRAAPIQEGDRIDGVAFTFRDVTRRRTEELAERRRLERWHRAAANLPDPVFLKDELGNYIGGNAAAAQLVAREQQAIAGAEDAALFSPEVARNIIQADRLAFESGQPQSYQLVVGDGAERRIFNAVKTPITDTEGKLSGLVDVLHEVTNAALVEEKLKKANRDLERRLEEQALAHKNTLEQLRQAHAQECAELHAVRSNAEDSWNEQLEELRRRLDEKTIAHAEAEALLAALPEKHAQEYEEKMAVERATSEDAWKGKLGNLKDEHSAHVEKTLQAERLRGEGLRQLAQQEHDRALAEYQAAWESAEEALQKAKQELHELRGRPAPASDGVAAKAERQELIRRIAEQTAARLGLEESLRRANERMQKLKEALTQPRELDLHQAEELRRQVARDYQQKLSESESSWQHRLEAAAQESAERLASAESFWQELQADYERQLKEARDRHLEELRGLQEQHSRPVELDQRQVEEIHRQAVAEHERKWQDDRLAWQHRLEFANGEHEQRLRSAQESWRQTLAEYDRRLTEARNQTAENDALRAQLEQSRNETLLAQRERDRLIGVLNERIAVSANGKASVSKAAYDAWEGTAERPNPDWLSFN